MKFSLFPELLAVYGPFFLSLLLLTPKGDWIPRTKLRDILPSDETLTNEVLLTVELSGRLEKLIEIAGFDVILMYLNFVSCLIEREETADSNIIGAVVILIAYHAVLGFSSRVIYNDISAIGYPHLTQRFKVVLGCALKGSTYLLLLTSGLAIWALVCTAGFRWALLGRI